jgi:hypothetical protein
VCFKYSSHPKKKDNCDCSYTVDNWVCWYNVFNHPHRCKCDCCKHLSNLHTDDCVCCLYYPQKDKWRFARLGEFPLLLVYTVQYSTVQYSTPLPFSTVSTLWGLSPINV